MFYCLIVVGSALTLLFLALLGHYDGLQFLGAHRLWLGFGSDDKPHLPQSLGKFGIALGLGLCGFAAFARLLVVVVVIAFVEEYKRDVVSTVKIPVA